MSIKYFANRVKETSTTTGNGNIVLSGPSTGFKSFINGIGANNTLTYYIYRQDTNFEWEIGTGYVFDSGGVNILVREQAISSSNNNNLVSFTPGTKFVETIISEDRINTSLLNVVEKSGDFTPVYMPATYVVDASVSGVQVSLPAVALEDNPIIIGFVLNKTIGDQYSQPNGIVLVPSGTETIAGTGSYDVSIRDDYLQIMSLPSQSGWVLLDPVQDSSEAYGDNGSIQVKYDSAFSGVNKFNWDFTNSALLIGGTGTITSASVIIPSSSGSTVVFNEQSHANDLRVEGTGNPYLLFIDGSENKIAINSSNASDNLIVNAQYGDGITVYRSGIGPQITINNTSVSGVATNDIVGSIVFSGLNDSGNSVQYGKIYSKTEEVYDSAESSSINMEIIKNGSVEPVAVLSASGISIGFNNSNIDGILIGEISQNEGSNIVLGYYQNICGDNCVAIGHNGALASGTFGGLIGTDHTASGNNIWIIGGSGVSISGDNKTYLAIDNNNHISVDKSGSLVYATFSSGNQNFLLKNTYALSSGVNQYINFVFDNSSGTAKTGLIFGSTIIDPIGLSEDTKLVSSILSSGSGVQVLDIGARNINIGNASVTGNNIVFAINSAVSGISNNIFGSGISASGNNNILIGNNIVHSGNNTTILGKDVTCSTSGNIGITIFGNNNIADEDYVSLFGHSNSASGLHAIAVGYLNGVHGEYSIGVGESNLVLMDGSVTVGNNNSLSGLSIDATAFTLGIGNTVHITNTGLCIGYSNEIYGSGGFALGQDVYSSGNNNVIIGNFSSINGSNNGLLGNSSSIIGSNDILIGNGISFSGNNTLLLAHSGSVEISGTPGTTIYNPILKATNNSLSVTDTGIYINASGLARISGASSIANYAPSLLYQANTGNKIEVTSTGTSVYGSGLTIGYNSLDNNIVFTSGSITASGITNIGYNNNQLTITSTAATLRNSSHYVEVTSSDVNIISSDIDLLSSNLITISNTGLVSTGILLQSSGLTLKANNNNIRIDTTQIAINSSGTTSINGSGTVSVIGSGIVDISGGSAVSISRGINSIDLYSTGINIVSNTGSISYSVGQTGDNHTFYTAHPSYPYAMDRFIINNTGIAFNEMDTFGTSYPNITIGNNDIRFYHSDTGSSWMNYLFMVLQSGTMQVDGSAKFGSIGVPSCTMDIDGDLKVNAATSGIIYQGYLTSTGCGVPLVIEDDIIKASNFREGCGVLSSTGSFPSSSTLYSFSEKIQLLDPNDTVYSLYLDSTFNHGREFFIRNTSPSPSSEQIDVIDSFTSTTLCTLGGSGIPGSGDLSCHVVFDTNQWKLVSISK